MTTTSPHLHSHSRSLPRRLQQGNALIYTMCALVIAGLMAAVEVNRRIIDHKVELGRAEATVLEVLRNAVNNAISENTPALQRGLPLLRDGSTAPGVVPQGGVWAPTIPQLVAMGYLPPGWNTTTSAINDGAYRIEFQRQCVTADPATCDIVGLLILQAPITDGIIAGPILQRLGVDGGMSLAANPSASPPTDPAILVGYDNSWTVPNPVPNTPAGIIAVRIGTQSSAWASFVRIGDNRDPKLAGNLSAKGNLHIEGTSNFGGSVTLQGTAPAAPGTSAFNINDSTGNPCMQVTEKGALQLTCDGTLNAVSGVFQQGMTAGNLELARTDPNTLVMRAGELVMRNPVGGGFVRFTGLGDIEASRNVTAGQSVITPQVQLNTGVAEGSDCPPGAMAALAGGGVAFCANGTYRALTRYGVNKAACLTEGSKALDQTTGEDLQCRNGQWLAISNLISDMPLMGSTSVRNGDTIPMPPCRDTGSQPPVPLAYLMAGNEQQPPLTAPALNRGVTPDFTNRVLNNGYWTGGTWTINLTDGNGQPIDANVNTNIAMVYCWYR